MKLNSTWYIISFAVAVCIGCSFLVSTPSVFLKSRQSSNALVYKQRNVLSVAGLVAPGESLSSEQVRTRFEERVKPVLINLETDELAGEDAGIDPATYNQRKAAADPAQSVEAEPNPAAVSRVPKYAVIYEVLGTENPDKVEKYVIPVEGLGLWGTLYGFVALEADVQTIAGLTFYSHKETPGLGGEVDNPLWKAKWPGREAFDENGKPVVHVIKGPAGPAEADPHKVDGLSGATITSNGVTNLLHFWLGEQGFGPYLAKLRGEGSAA